MNAWIGSLSLYFLVTGALECFFPKKTGMFLMDCLRFRPFRLFSLWALGVGGVAYCGSPVNHLMWFVVFLIWLYGFMGFWILISPHSFLRVVHLSFEEMPEDRRDQMIQFDGFLRWVVSLLLFLAARP